MQSEWWTDRPDQPVKIRFGESGAASEGTETVVQLFEKTVMGYGEHVALAVKRVGEWRQWTYKKYYNECVTIAKAMIEVGGRGSGRWMCPCSLFHCSYSHVCMLTMFPVHA